MNTAAERSEVKDPKTGMTHAEMKEFIRNHFEEFVNRKNLRIGEANFAPDFLDHGADVPPGLPPGPAGAIQYVGAALKKVPNLSVSIEDLVREAFFCCAESEPSANCTLQNKRPRESKFTRPWVGFRFVLWIRQISPQIV